MSKLQRIASAVAASGLAATAAIFPAVLASAQSSCDWYASTAVKQQQENERLKCGFTGPAWSTDLKAHKAWCASVPPDTWKKEAQKRDQQLGDCATRK